MRVHICSDCADQDKSLIAVVHEVLDEGSLLADASLIQIDSTDTWHWCWYSVLGDDRELVTHGTGEYD